MADHRLMAHPGRLRRLALPLAVLALALVQGCTLLPTDTAAPPKPVPIADGSWDLVTSSFVGAGRIPGVPRATLAFQDGRLAAFGGCNSAAAAGHTLEGRLQVTALTTTRRDCPEPLSTFEIRFFKLLQAKPSLYIEGDTLILSGAEHNARFRRANARAVQTAP